MLAGIRVAFATIYHVPEDRLYASCTVDVVRTVVARTWCRAGLPEPVGMVGRRHLPGFGKQWRRRWLPPCGGQCIWPGVRLQLPFQRALVDRRRDRMAEPRLHGDAGGRSGRDNDHQSRAEPVHGPVQGYVQLSRRPFYAVRRGRPRMDLCRFQRGGWPADRRLLVASTLGLHLRRLLQHVQ